ncbi:FecCD family ABC transporter permease [Actinomycetospora termitidis]|uniref:Iron chelate uptake ABC transporter family permease subunit n=1 Tax=Actinomycetospora termitidis TaxID=3053470 RepID=A0ABT7M789_9PSEU|nr:iron chelate uptake ABC transporter family permease subunit [Actinomycetospora sp. Odt1-22]MDL5156532.1 iron chelate uptake ABC transporter family permease subunit [Actinomycetospora sp. Odt1-22]
MTATATAVTPTPRPRRGAGITATLGIGAVLLVAVVASLAIGPRALPPSVVLDALTAFDPMNPDHLIVTEVRVPRTVIGLLAGLALGPAGVLAQGLTRNPIAEPGILGLNTGAALAVVLAIGLLGIRSLTAYVWFGFLGAGVAALIVAGVAGIGRSGTVSRGATSPATLALAGAALTAGLGSVTTAILLTDPNAFEDYRFWQVGSLAGRDLGIAGQAAPFVLAGLALALVCGPTLNALALGDDVARSFGRHVERDRVVCGIALVVLAGSATAVAGPIAFVGLTVPHIVRALTGPDHRRLLPLSALAAPTLLLVADVLGRVVATPREVQVGIVTAVLGAPLFIWFVRRKRFVR